MWFLIAIAAYFIIALQIILDKFLISSKKVSHPVLYAFYSGALSLVTLILFPFGAHTISFFLALLYFSVGIIFVYGILLNFFAFREGEASQVTPVIGAVSPIFIYFLSILILGEKLGNIQLVGIFILIVGGLAISFNFGKKMNKNKFFSGFSYAVFAGMLLAVTFTLEKFFYQSDNFLNVFVWSRVGVTVGALSFFLVPAWRKIIIKSLKGAKKDKDKNVSTGKLFVANKILGGFGSYLNHYAFSIGAVTVVSALVSIEYVFILLLGIILSFRFPKVFKEEKNPHIIFQKVMATAIIVMGAVLVTLGTRP